jgi:hypothetical protein
MFRRHSGRQGVWYRVHYAALETRLGPFDPAMRLYAGGASALWVTWRLDSDAAEEASQARQEGRGRRPSAQAVARLKKRAALSWGSYDAALRRLEGMAEHRPFDPGTLFNKGEGEGMGG